MLAVGAFAVFLVGAGRYCLYSMERE
jgi:hypothetical protein